MSTGCADLRDAVHRHRAEAGRDRAGVRVLVEGLGPVAPSWEPMLTVLAVLSLGIGNVVAIAQTNIKRMLAYSTIGHVGFIFLGLLTGTQAGLEAALFYTRSSTSSWPPPHSACDPDEPAGFRSRCSSTISRG